MLCVVESGSLFVNVPRLWCHGRATGEVWHVLAALRFQLLMDTSSLLTTLQVAGGLVACFNCWLDCTFYSVYGIVSTHMCSFCMSQHATLHAALLAIVAFGHMLIGNHSTVLVSHVFTRLCCPQCSCLHACVVPCVSRPSSVSAAVCVGVCVGVRGRSLYESCAQNTVE